MKPLLLEFQAFGPYAGKESINFEDLSDKGLLLICGDTGSGKTMILDAMTLALYGKASGGVRNDFSAMRCNRCNPDDDTFISFVFEAGGAVYKFERRLEKKRVNLSESQQIYRMDGEGRFEPVREKLRKSEMPAIAEEIIGLDYDQFTQVMILPQGKFEKFLESDSGQKGEILTEIFGAERWEKTAGKYFELVKADYDRLNNLKTHVKSILSSEGCDDLDGLKKKIEDQSEELRKLELRIADADYDGRHRKLQADKETASRIEELKNTLRRREKELKNAERTSAEQETGLEKALSRLEEHKSREADRENWNREKTLLETKKDLYTNAEKVKEAFQAADSAWQEACAKAEKADRTAEQAKRKEAEALLAYEKADHEHKEALDAFARGAAGRLAADLKEGEKCPVCGSTHHPEPAVAGDDAVSSAQVDEKYEILGKKREAWKEAGIKTGKAQEAAVKARDERAELEITRTAADKELQESRAGMVDGIGSLQELEQRIAKINRAITDFDAALAELTGAAEQSKVSLAEAKTAAAKAQEEAGKASEDLENGLKLLEEQTGSGVEPDVGAIERQIKQIEAEKDAASREQGSLNSGIERLRELYAQLEEDWETFTGQISNVEDALAFARQLRGDSGTGLKRYVLGIMFDQVVFAANEMLSKVHGGRYSLVRTEDSMTGSRKRGLDLAVLDSFSDTDGLRPAGSLSGGEKFLVSLALSIGMSTIARTDGINIDAMFIDEGFGSLDEHSIGDALEVLESIRGGADSFIGIISHVQILRDSIPSKLIVHKSRRTSTIEYTMG